MLKKCSLLEVRSTTRPGPPGPVLAGWGAPATATPQRGRHPKGPVIDDRFVTATVSSSAKRSRPLSLQCSHRALFGQPLQGRAAATGSATGRRPKQALGPTRAGALPKETERSAKLNARHFSPTFTKYPSDSCRPWRSGRAANSCRRSSGASRANHVTAALQVLCTIVNRPGVCWRLQPLRRWSHEQVEQVFP